MQCQFRLAIILFFLSIQPAFADISNGLVGWWQFDDGSGTTAADHSNQFGATAHNGALTGSISWVAGKYGMGLSFPSGSGNWIDFGNNVVGSLLNGKSGSTLSFWFNYSGVNGGNPILFAGEIGSSATKNAVLCWFASAYTLQCGGRSEATDNFQGLTYGSSITVGAWYYVTLVQNLAANTVSLYINGQLTGSSAASYGSTTFVNSVSPNDDEMGNNYQLGYNFYGIMDDVRLYNRALSAGEVWDLYQGGAQGLGGD